MGKKKKHAEDYKERHRICEVKSTGDQFILSGKVWIDGPEGTFLGYGRVILLERIKEHGSISSAARSLGMSYRQAWRLVDSMNRQLGKPLVETFIGGKRGGGAKLTEAGERVLSLFWTFYKDFQEFLEKEKEKILSQLP
mgnify:CR=1 FL=1